MLSKGLLAGMVIGSLVTGTVTFALGASGTEMVEGGVSELQSERQPNRQPNRQPQRQPEVEENEEEDRDRDDEDRERDRDRDRERDRDMWQRSGQSAKLDALRDVLVRKGVLTQGELNAALEAGREREDSDAHDEDGERRGRGQGQGNRRQR